MIYPSLFLLPFPAMKVLSLGGQLGLLIITKIKMVQYVEADNNIIGYNMHLLYIILL